MGQGCSATQQMELGRAQPGFYEVVTCKDIKREGKALDFAAV